MKQWVAFWSLGLIWGSSFLLIKIAVEELGALPLVSLRLTLAAALMLLYLFTTRRRLPDRWVDRIGLIFVSIFNIAIPFTLITRAEEQIDSNVATIINSSVPLFSLILAHFALHDERLSTPKVVGLLIGFAGIIVLTWRGLTHPEESPLSGQLLMLLATSSYAVAVVFIRRRLRHVESITVAGSTLVMAAVIMVLVTLLTENNLPDLGSLETKTWFAIVVLGVINTVVAYFLFYDLIDKWGARATMVTYVFPPVGILLGAIFLDEPVDFRLLLGAALILCGIFAVNFKPKKIAPPLVNEGAVQSA